LLLIDTAAVPWKPLVDTHIWAQILSLVDTAAGRAVALPWMGKPTPFRRLNVDVCATSCRAGLAEHPLGGYGDAAGGGGVGAEQRQSAALGRRRQQARHAHGTAAFLLVVCCLLHFSSIRMRWESTEWEDKKRDDPVEIFFSLLRCMWNILRVALERVDRFRFWLPSILKIVIFYDVCLRRLILKINLIFDVDLFKLSILKYLFLIL
jgi:hypothetical protein